MTISTNSEPESSDEQLLDRLQKSDQSALSELYELYAHEIFQQAYRILNNQSDAEDLVHDIFLEVWQRAKSYDPQRGSVRNWLLVRVRSRAIDRLRVLQLARKHHNYLSQTQELRYNAAHDFSIEADSERANKALKSLPEAQRQIIELSYFRSLTCLEIAQCYKIPIGTVKSRLQAGVRKLRKHLVSKRRSADV